VQSVHWFSIFFSGSQNGKLVINQNPFKTRFACHQAQDKPTHKEEHKIGTKEEDKIGTKYGHIKRSTQNEHKISKQKEAHGRIANVY
jgi:hypothetical protein